MAKNMNFSKNHALQEAITTSNRAAGTNNINGITMDCQNAECVVAIVEFGTISATAVTSLVWQGSDDGTDLVYS